MRRGRELGPERPGRVHADQAGYASLFSRAGGDGAAPPRESRGRPPAATARPAHAPAPMGPHLGRGRGRGACAQGLGAVMDGLRRGLAQAAESPDVQVVRGLLCSFRILLFLQGCETGAGEEWSRTDGCRQP